jgi:adhesin/invasin
VTDGTAASGSPLSNTVAVPTTSGTTCLNSQPSMCVAIGSSGFGDVKYSGLAPGFIGLWQINVVLPTGLAAGNVPLRIVINGTPSNTVTVAVR